jgi:hypothetical protein
MSDLTVKPAGNPENPTGLQGPTYREERNPKCQAFQMDDAEIYDQLNRSWVSWRSLEMSAGTVFSIFSGV